MKTTATYAVLLFLFTFPFECVWTNLMKNKICNLCTTHENNTQYNQGIGSANAKIFSFESAANANLHKNARGFVISSL